MFYRKKANEHGISVSDYLRQMLIQGVIAENVQEIEWKLRQIIEEIKNNSTSNSHKLPDKVLLSILRFRAQSARAYP